MEKMTISEKVGIVLFLIPAVVLFFTYFIYPIGFVSVTSMMKWDGLSEPEFVGLNNFTILLHDKVFQRAIINNILWSCSGGFIHVPMAALAAMLLSKKPKGWKFFRTIYFFPNIISIIALAMMWMAIYNNEYGALNALLDVFGLEQLQNNWLGNVHTAFPALISHWIFNIGYFMVIILAQISTISSDYYEAAKIDGADGIKQDLYITLPMIKNTVLTCMTLSMVNGLKHFESVFIMTNGGPANRSMMLSLYLYKQLSNFRYGLANASGVILIIIGICVIIGLNRLFRISSIRPKKRYKGGEA